MVPPLLETSGVLLSWTDTDHLIMASISHEVISPSPSTFFPLLSFRTMKFGFHSPDASSRPIVSIHTHIRSPTWWLLTQLKLVSYETGDERRCPVSDPMTVLYLWGQSLGMKKTRQLFLPQTPSQPRCWRPPCLGWVRDASRRRALGVTATMPPGATGAWKNWTWQMEWGRRITLDGPSHRDEQDETTWIKEPVWGIIYPRHSWADCQYWKLSHMCLSPYICLPVKRRPRW